jgi:hypothetical protein
MPYIHRKNQFHSPQICSIKRGFMNIYRLNENIRVFGIQVNSAPERIGAAFDMLAKMVDGGFNRSFYGISMMNKGKFIYRAATEEIFEGEGDKYACEKYTIEQGYYLAVTLRDWRKKTESIKDIFHEMMHDHRVDCTKPFVEWYKDDDEMICMVKVDKPEDDR